MTYDVGYGQLKQKNPFVIERLKAANWWNDFVEICETPTTIDSKVQGVVSMLLTDPDFIKTWSEVVAYYGHPPTIVLTNSTLHEIHETYIDIPVQLISGLTLRILRPPEIRCTNRLFPSIAIMSIVYEIYKLHTNISLAQEIQTKKDYTIALKVMHMLLKIQFIRGGIKLDVPPEISEEVTFDLSPCKLILLIKKGKDKIFAIKTVPIDIFIHGVLCLPNDIALQAIKSVNKEPEEKKLEDDFVLLTL